MFYRCFFLRVYLDTLNLLVIKFDPNSDRSTCDLQMINVLMLICYSIIFLECLLLLIHSSITCLWSVGQFEYIHFFVNYFSIIFIKLSSGDFTEEFNFEYHIDKPNRFLNDKAWVTVASYLKFYCFVLYLGIRSSFPPCLKNKNFI